jgi:hypothetical protein
LPCRRGRTSYGVGPRRALSGWPRRRHGGRPVLWGPLGPLSSTLARSGPSPSLLFSDTALATVHPQTTHTTQTTQASLSPPPSHSAAAALTSPLPFPSSPGRSASTSPDKSLSPSTRDAPRHACRQVLSPLLHPRPPRLSPTSLACACACARDSPTLPLSPGAYEDLASSLLLSLSLSLSISLYLSISLALFHRSLRPPTTQHARDHLAHLLTHALVRLRLRC